jgi:hypothetical protein
MYKPRRVTRSFSAVVIIGLTLAITGGIIPVSVSKQQQHQNSTSSQSMKGIDMKMLHRDL